MNTITTLLRQVENGHEGAMNRLFAHVYDDLRKVARQQLLNHRAGVLQATALVNAAYERLATKETINAADRKHLFFLFSRAMHDVLVEQARANLSLKRGGGVRHIPLVEISMDERTQHVEIFDLQEALSQLGLAEPEAAHMITLRFYSGMTLEEAAEAMNISFAVARRHWEYGKAWLHERLTRGQKRLSGN